VKVSGVLPGHLQWSIESPISKPPSRRHFQIHRRPINSTKETGCSKNMGLWLEVKEKTICLDSYCVARAVIESVLERVGVLNAQVEKMVERYVERLGELISDGWYDGPYTFEVGNLRISVYDIEFDVVECQLEGCKGYVVASILLDSDFNTMREVAKAIIRNMGIDKYVKCE
jgi:hypothetical protein